MSKRLSTSQRADTKKRRTVQTSLYKFFDSDSASKLKTGVNPPAATHAQASASTSRALTVPGTPQEFGIHVYTQAQIESSKGMLKDYRLFWNDKVYELCSDVAVREKLKDKSAIQGAINVSWTMQKSSLLQVQADEVREESKTIYTDPVGQVKRKIHVEKHTVKSPVKLSDMEIEDLAHSVKMESQIEDYEALSDHD